MYRVTYPKLLEILEKGGCQCAITELQERNLKDCITTIEIDFAIDDEDTEDEILTVIEFNIYLNSNIVLFGASLKHESDFTIEWARTKPCANYKELEPTQEKKKTFTDKAQKALEFLSSIEFDQEYNDPNDTKKFWEYYNEAFNTICALLKKYESALENISNSSGKLGDLSRIIEKMSDGEDLELITKHIDQIYNILKQE